MQTVNSASRPTCLNLSLGLELEEHFVSVRYPFCEISLASKMDFYFCDYLLLTMFHLVLANKIHISNSTAELLTGTKGFVLESRGEREITKVRDQQHEK